MPLELSIALQKEAYKSNRRASRDNLSCSRCSKTGRIHLHHEDYTKPESVIPLCPSCHRKRHTELGWGNSGRPWAVKTIVPSLIRMPMTIHFTIRPSALLTVEDFARIKEASETNNVTPEEFVAKAISLAINLVTPAKKGAA